MAASSSSTPTPPVNKYDVFLSFRGKDTRRGFVSHLFKAFEREKIYTFMDEEGLEQGEEIKPTLLSTIEMSTISVVVISVRFADSKWCLEELVKIIECQDKYGQHVLPGFFKVEPTDVRHQTESFGNGFSELQSRFVEDENMLQKWRNALEKVADYAGFGLNSSSSIKNEADLVEKIVQHILKILNRPSSIDNDELVGVYSSSVEEIKPLLLKYSILGIWGMGGIGKTSFAKAVFKNIEDQFVYSYFVDNVREKSEDNSLKTFCIRKQNLGCKRVLIVLDDVTTVEQINYLIGDFMKNFRLGSRIIISTRDKKVLEQYQVDTENIYIYELKGLSNEKALQLFSWYAFRKNCRSSEFLSLSNRVVDYAKGLPLALKELGTFLCTKASKEEWESKINSLERYPDQQILKVLKLSFDELDDPQKDIFLDMSKIGDIFISSKAFKNMKTLGLFKLQNSSCCGDEVINKVHNFGGLKSNDLSYLSWHGCPLKSLRSKFYTGNLVVLDMPYSKVVELTVDQHLDNLKHINLSHSKRLLEITNLSLASNLECLILEGCTKLSKICPSIRSLTKLVVLNLRHCEGLGSLSCNIHELKSLKHLHLSGCPKLQGLAEIWNFRSF